jgi:acyl carrier protein
MNEEIGKILNMLEEGKISAEDAERLIRALCETESARGKAGKRRPCGTGKEPHDLWQALCRALRRAARRQRRIAWWQFHWQLRQAAEARRKRAAEMSVAGRVQWLFVECGFADPGDIPATASLDADLEFDPVARQILRYALEEEFDIAVNEDEVLELTTFGDVVAFVEGRLPSASSTPASETPGPSPEPEPQG